MSERTEKVHPLFAVGDIVSLRSGGPMGTVTDVTATGNTRILYFNTVTGLFEGYSINQVCLRPSTLKPVDPEGLAHDRSTGLAPVRASF